MLIQTPINAQQEYQLRFLGLCAERIRQSGECLYPPLLAVFQRYETAGGTHWQERPDVELARHAEQITTLRRNALIAVRQLQAEIRYVQSNSTPVSQVQAFIQIATTESQALSTQVKELQVLLNSLSDIVSPLQVEELTPALKTLSFACEYLLHKEAVQESLASPQIAARFYRYLSDLQEVSDAISRTCLDKIAEAELALGIFDS